MLREFKSKDCHYFQDDQNRIQGEYTRWKDNGVAVHCYYHNNNLHGEFKSWYENGNIARHYFYVNGNLHGEYKEWDENGQLYEHMFYIDDKQFSFKEIPYPQTPEDRVYIMLKYNLQLLPVEN